MLYCGSIQLRMRKGLARLYILCQAKGTRQEQNMYYENYFSFSGTMNAS